MGAGGASTTVANGGIKLVGHKNFVRYNPQSDRFAIKRFHSFEFWCADATNTYKRWVVRTRQG